MDIYKDQILGALTVGLKTSNTRNNAINAFMHALDLEGFFTDEELGFIVHTVNAVTFEPDVSSGDEASAAPLYVCVIYEYTKLIETGNHLLSYSKRSHQ